MWAWGQVTSGLVGFMSELGCKSGQHLLLVLKGDVDHLGACAESVEPAMGACDR